MKITFGNHLDGCPSPSSQLGLDILVVGPAGFLDLLELRLGLSPVTGEGLDRILAYRSALEESAAQAERFFSASLSVDPLASARVLLQWRDELALAGWEGNADDDAPARLQDLASVESQFRKSKHFPTSAPSRLRNVLSSLGSGLDPRIETVQLADPIEFFPALWREALTSLPVTEHEWDLPRSPLAVPGTRLHHLQSSLLDENPPEAPHPSETDCSLRVVESSGISSSAAAAASLLASETSGSCLIGEPTSLAPLNAALHQRDLPVFNSASRTAAGTLTQLAPLVLRLHWEPFDPQSLLEFLLHPVSPLSRRLSRNLAYALNQTPSRKNRRWSKAIEDTLEKAADDQERKRIREQLSTWLDVDTFPDKAPGTTYAETTRRLATWMGKRGGLAESLPERAPWLAACKSLHHLARALDISGELTCNELERLIAEWLPTAMRSESSGAELGDANCLSSPAHLLEPVEHLIWWLPSHQTAPRLPWNRSELAWLANRGTALIDPQSRQRIQQRETFRAVLGASQSLTIFHCSSPSGAEATPSILVRIFAECGHDQIVQSPSQLLDPEPVASRPLPPQDNQWSISDPQLLSRRDSESFSSLHKFLYSPWEWVLDYKARLRPGPIKDFRIVDDARRRGSLLHGFVESLLEPELDEDPSGLVRAPHPTQSAPAASLLETLVRRVFHDQATIDWQSVSREAIHEWVESEWHHILGAQAAHYLVPGHEASRSELLYLAKTGLWELITQFREAHIRSVRCEEKIDQCGFCGGLLNGFIDLQVTSETGGVAVIDLKLGGKSFRREELANGRHLQLAVYGHLLHTTHSQEAHIAYFIFSGGGTLLARSNEFFPGATVVPSKRGVPPGDWHACWDEFEVLWKERREQLDRGEVEVTLTTFKPALTPSHWTIPEPDRFTPYRILSGWEATK